MQRRGAYRPHKGDELDRIEQRRKRAGVTIEELADRAGITARQIYRIRRSGHAFPRTVMALRMALREIEKAKKLQDALFPTGEA